MKIALALALALVPVASGAQGVPALRAPVPMPPVDWTTLPDLRFQRPLASMAGLSAYVRAEVDGGRCASVARSASSAVVQVDLAVLVTADSHVRRIVPRAIDCIAVEQYAAGLISRLARDNIDNLGVEKDTWFRTTLVFAWPV